MTEDWYSNKLRKRRCECGTPGCTGEIEISLEEEDAIDHTGRNLWKVVPGHDLQGAGVTKLVSSNERFSVVEVFLDD